MKNSASNMVALTHDTEIAERLCAEVMQRIEKQKMTSLKIGLWLFGFFSLTTLASVAVMIVFIIQDLHASGFGEITSTLVTDFSTVPTKNSLISIADLTPVTWITGLVLFLIVALLFLRRLSYFSNTLRDYKENNLSLA